MPGETQHTSEVTAEPSGATPRFRTAIFVDHLFNSLGLFSLFPVMGLLLAARSEGSGTAVVGIGLFCYTASAGLSALLINRVLPKIRYRTGMVGSMLVAGAGFGLLPYVGSVWSLCALLLFAGFGMSIHFVLSRVLVAELVHDDIGRNKIYSLLQIGVNVGAAVGPFIASFLYSDVDPRLLLGIVSGCYVLAAASMYLGVPGSPYPPPTTNRWPISGVTLRAILHKPEVWQTVLIGTLGAFVYAQFFSAFALLVAHELDSAALRSVLLAAPAVLIVFLQAGVTGGVSKFMKSGMTPLRVLAYATTVFGVAMLLLGSGLPLVLSAVGAVMLYSLAEMLFTPMVSTAFAALPIESKLEAFNLRQVCWTLGEAFGSLAGGSVFLAMHLAGTGRWYWLALCALTVVITTTLLVGTRKATSPLASR